MWIYTFGDDKKVQFTPQFFFYKYRARWNVCPSYNFQFVRVYISSIDIYWLAQIDLGQLISLQQIKKLLYSQKKLTHQVKNVLYLNKILSL